MSVAYITENLWYAVIQREDSHGWFYYTVKKVVPCQGQEEWPVVTITTGRMARQRAIDAADELDQIVEAS